MANTLMQIVLPGDSKEEIAVTAKRLGVSVSAFMREAAAEKIGRHAGHPPAAGPVASRTATAAQAA